MQFFAKWSGCRIWNNLCSFWRYWKVAFDSVEYFFGFFPLLKSRALSIRAPHTTSGLRLLGSWLLRRLIVINHSVVLGIDRTRITVSSLSQSSEPVAFSWDTRPVIFAMCVDMSDFTSKVVHFVKHTKHAKIKKWASSWFLAEDIWQHLASSASLVEANFFSLVFTSSVARVGGS